MKAFVLAALGGALGAALRYGAGLWAAKIFGAGFPIATLGVNIFGGFAMGLLVGCVPLGDRNAHLFWGVGLLGGFTTFSAFSIELVRLMEQGDAGLALGYALASVVAATIACYAGLVLARSFA